MIIDAHTHIFETGRGGPFDLPSSADDLVRDMDAAGIDVSVVIPLPGIASNEFVHRECARLRDRLRGLYTPEFDRPSETVKRMEKFFETWSPKGIKIHPRLQNVTVNDSIVREVLDWAAGKQVPVLFDVFPYGPSLGDPATHPLAYHAVAQKLPDLKLILAHAGGLKLMDAFLTAKSNSNVWLEVSVTPVYFRWSSLVGDCAFMCRRLPPGRVLYGSDFPYVRVEESLTLAREWSADLDQPVRVELFGAAAERIYSL